MMVHPTRPLTALFAAFSSSSFPKPKEHHHREQQQQQQSHHKHRYNNCNNGFSWWKGQDIVQQPLRRTSLCWWSLSTSSSSLSSTTHDEDTTTTTTTTEAKSAAAAAEEEYSVASSPDDAAALDSARALLFDDQHQSLIRQAEIEHELIQPNMKVMKEISKKKLKQISNSNAKKKTRSVAGVGFGSGGGGGGRISSSSTTSTTKSASKSKPSGVGEGSSTSSSKKLDPEIEGYASILEEDGVVLVPKVLSRDKAHSFRDCVISEIEIMRDMIRKEPELSHSLFYVPAKIHFTTPRGYVLLPFRDSTTTSVSNGDPNDDDVGIFVRALRDVIGTGSLLGNLFSRICDGMNSQLYDYCVLRTEPGATQQIIHSDTPYQKPGGLYCAFIALQDVSYEMGGTLFIPKTHNTPASIERQQFDMGGIYKDEMLSNVQSQYTMLKAGDAAIFDMRILHAGLANQIIDGSNRYLLAITFYNQNAKEILGHKPNLRPGYVGLYTLEELQKELNSRTPFVHVGDGLIK